MYEWVYANVFASKNASIHFSRTKGSISHLEDHLHLLLLNGCISNQKKLSFTKIACNSQTPQKSSLKKITFERLFSAEHVEKVMKWKKNCLKKLELEFTIFKSLDLMRCFTSQIIKGFCFPDVNILYISHHKNHPIYAAASISLT